HTISDRDWSSDVCSSDLGRAAVPDRAPGRRAVDEAHRLHAARYRGIHGGEEYKPRPHSVQARSHGAAPSDRTTATAGNDVAEGEIGRASCRESVEMACVA